MIDLSYIASFDTETTGVNVLEDRIVTASIAYLDPVGNVIENYEWLINPGVEIPEEASAVHGVTNERAQSEGQAPAQAIYEIAGIIAYFLNNGAPIIAYNAAFDFSILNAEINRHIHLAGAIKDYLPDPYADGLSAFLDGPNLQYIIDPYIIDLKMDKWRKGSRTLTASAAHYGVTLEDAHQSFADCIAAAEVTRAIWKDNPILVSGTYGELFELQTDWYREIMEDRREYFQKQGKEMNDFSTEWPIRAA